MLVKADGEPRERWCLRDPQTKVINLAYMCKTEAEALKLRRAHLIHKKHEGMLEITQVFLTITEAEVTA